MSNKERRNKVIILGNAPHNNGNLGCVALTYSAIGMIDEIMNESQIPYELFLTDSGFRDRYHHIGLPGRDIRYQTLVNPYPLTLKALAKKVIYLPQTLRASRVFRRCDKVLDLGQGDSFSDIYGLQRFHYIDVIHRAARFFGRPYCLLPQTIGPFNGHEAKRLSAQSLSRADMVMARDAVSLQYVKDHIPAQKHVDEYIDMAFVLPFTRQVFPGGRIHVGLNVSALLWHGGYERNNQFGLRCDYQRLVRQVITFFLSLDNMELHLIPHVLSIRNTNNETVEEQVTDIEDDMAVSKLLVDEFAHERLRLSPQFATPIEAKSYIAGLDFFLGARMHATIAAFSAGVPVVPMAYSRKFNGLFQDTLAYSWLADMKKNSEEEALAMISKAYGVRSDLKDQIRNTLDTVVKERVERMRHALAEFLKR